MDRAEIAGRLRAQRAEIGGRLAALVADWAKYSHKYQCDPVAFAQLETYTLVDYLALLIETGNESFLNLYIGEKAKQFHDPATDAAVRRASELAVLEGERAVFLSALAGSPDAAAIIDSTFDTILFVLTSDADTEVRALFVGDCLYLDVISFLTAPALADGVRLRPTFITTHDPSEIRAKIAELSDERFDVVFFSPFTYALLDDYQALQRPRVWAPPQQALKHIHNAVANGLDIFDTLTDLFDCPIVAHAPAAILRREGKARDRISGLLTHPLRDAATRRLAAALRRRAVERNRSGRVVHIVEEAQVAGPGGLPAAGRYLFRSDLQHPAAFGAMLAPYYRDILMVVGRMRKRKLVACDLDNTLWDGVIGEGLGVNHHYDRQSPLLKLKERGVVLAINSKNDPAKAVWEAADGNLALDHFISRQINWDPKPLNMQRIAKHLNLKEKDFVFIDDRADERALVQEAYPTLLTLDALEPRSWRLLALWADLLPSKPGADRTDFYRQRDARQAFIATETEISIEERATTYAKLDLRLVIREAGYADIDRVTDLINRTNQFNVTGARVTRRQIETAVASAEDRILIADAADRFGSMGTVSVLIVNADGPHLNIPVFVLSCRVFGYGMEFALLEEARSLARHGEILVGSITETPFNQPCRNLYAEAGFEPLPNDVWERAADKAIPVQTWLTIESHIRSPDPLAA